MKSYEVRELLQISAGTLQNLRVNGTYLIPRMLGQCIMPTRILLNRWKPIRGMLKRIICIDCFTVMEMLSDYVFGKEQLPARGDVLFITGGEKDVVLEIDFDHLPQTPEPLVSINEVTIGSPGNILGITGEIQDLRALAKELFHGKILLLLYRTNDCNRELHGSDSADSKELHPFYAAIPYYYKRHE